MNETQEQIKEENPVEENVIVDIDESEQKKIDTQPVVEKEEERTDVRSEQSETAQSIHELAQFYLQQDRPVAPEGRPETPIGFDPTRQPQAEFGGATAEQPTLIGTPLPVGLGTLTGIGQRELLEQLGQQNISGFKPKMFSTNEEVNR